MYVLIVYFLRSSKKLQHFYFIKTSHNFTELYTYQPLQSTIITNNHRHLSVTWPCVYLFLKVLRDSLWRFQLRIEIALYISQTRYTFCGWNVFVKTFVRLLYESKISFFKYFFIIILYLNSTIKVTWIHCNCKQGVCCNVTRELHWITSNDVLLK